MDGIKTELKTLNGTSVNTPITRITDGFKQDADVVIIDARKSNFTVEQIHEIFARAAGTYPDKQLPGRVEIWTKYGIFEKDQL